MLKSDFRLSRLKHLAPVFVVSTMITCPAWAGPVVPLLPADIVAPANDALIVVPVQAADPQFRINQLEEQMRQLNGKVEEMTFQMLQLQEQLRRMQEDNEFRFQELEQRGDLGSGGGGSTGGDDPGKSSASDAGTGQASGGGTGRRSIGDVIEQEGTPQNGDGTSAGAGQAPRELGTLTFDENGNILGSGFGQPIDLLGTQSGTSEGLPDSPDGLFDLGYQYVQAGEYDQAQQVFETYGSRYPDGDRAPEANFWLGESMLARGDFQSAARIFLNNHKLHPDGALAAENLLKLGVSLSGLGQRELACATLAEVPKKYPDLSNALQKRVVVEQRAAQCKSG